MIKATKFLILLLLILTCQILLNGIDWSIISLTLNLVSSLLIAIIIWRLRLINSKSDFIFLNFSFYRYWFNIFNTSFSNSIKLALNFLNPKHSFAPILDFILLDKERKSEGALYVNSINFLPGAACFTLKKHHLLLHCLDDYYMSKIDMHNLSNQLAGAFDDRLV